MPEDVQPRIRKALEDDTGHAGHMLYAVVERRYKRALELTRAHLRKDLSGSIEDLTLDDLERRRKELAEPSKQMEKMFRGDMEILDEITCQTFGKPDASTEERITTAVERVRLL